MGDVNNALVSVEEDAMKTAYREFKGVATGILDAVKTKDIGEMVAGLGKLEGTLFLNIVLAMALLALVYTHSSSIKKLRGGGTLVVKKSQSSRALVTRIGTQLFVCLAKIFLCIFLFLVLSIKFHELTWRMFGKRHEAAYDLSVENHVIGPMIAAGFKREYAENVLKDLGILSLSGVKGLMKEMVTIVTKTSEGKKSLADGIAEMSKIWMDKFSVLFHATIDNKTVLSATAYSALVTAYPYVGLFLGSVTGKGSQVAAVNVDITVMNTSIKMFVTTILTQKMMDISVILMTSIAIAFLSAQTAVFPRYSVLKPMLKGVVGPITKLLPGSATTTTVSSLSIKAQKS